ncbi:NINE protein [Haloparvum sp. PAK95]|uniref:NINE protein n=1 Tax=Haloparvum sp. PAK95 TaxID=3418962 RepID=UPI003D2EE060
MPESPDDSDDASPAEETADGTAGEDASSDPFTEPTPTASGQDTDADSDGSEASSRTETPGASPRADSSTPAESGPGGRSLAPDEQYCPSCGEPIKKAAEICPECGVRQQPPTSTEKDRVTAGILALLLGGIGAHKFYLGEAGMGILYLCFSWTFIPALVGLIEGILYLTKTDAEFERKYVN